MKIAANFKTATPETLSWTLFTRHGNCFNMALITLNRQTKARTVAVVRTNRKQWEAAQAEAFALPAVFHSIPADFHAEEFLNLVRSALPQCRNAVALS